MSPLRHDHPVARMADPAGALPILHLDDAIAVLCPGAAAGASRRTELATNALRRLTDAALTVIRRPSGRPALAPPQRELGVSLSHRGDWMIAGFSPSHDVGVDIETGDNGIDPLLMAQDHFASEEAAAIGATERDAGRDLFFRLWVAKEAALKATGRGIFDGLHSPDFGLDGALLLRDGQICRVMVGPQHRPVRLVTRRVEQAGASPLYIALAILDD